ncbi:hypothetical protein RhiirA4_473594 [Rhizophagus irregularis]|uniref:F-box domain-containing protein n=1 Tax=Rhizophagus irregularis TaxID=588596 RepID=A0A2I1H707_9GLOM|nr:hypothetical protein RhiirA4_473594 [Rhizophagus irregularis]
MFKLNRDILYLVFEELQNDNKTLYSCLLVNKTWCEIIVPILWKNPWKCQKEELLLNVIMLHLSDESRNNLRNNDFNFLTNSYQKYQKPFFDYISFCRHLHLNAIKRMINNNNNNYENSKKSMDIQYEIFNLFINKNTKFTHLYIPKQFDCQIHLIPGADQCFSELEYLFCQTSINENILVGLTDICRSIKAVKLFVDNNYIIKVLSFFVNIKSLELLNYRMTSDHIENLPLPSLQVLKAKGIPINVLERLIENTSGLLTEIRIDGISHNEINNKRIIQAIYQYCPNLKYLKIVFRYSNILELKNLLINCNFLCGLFILINNMEDVFDIDYLFEILAKSSPINLFKFKFKFRYRPVKLESLKSFFDNWKGRHPMYLHFIKKLENNIDDLIDLIEEYKTNGVIKKFNNGLDCKDFEWI